MSKLIEVYDPPMCCSTGICGPSVDPVLPRFAADLEWLAEKGVEVKRFNLGQNPGAFANAPIIRQLLQDKGNGCLPAILVDGLVFSTGKYLERVELAAAVGLSISPSRMVAIDSPEVKELIAIGASIAANCLACLKFHQDKATRLGLTPDDLSAAVNIGLGVKKTAGDHVLKLADSLLFSGEAKASEEKVSPPSCCSTTDAPSSGGSCCG